MTLANIQVGTVIESYARRWHVRAVSAESRSVTIESLSPRERGRFVRVDFDDLERAQLRGDIVIVPPQPLSPPVYRDRERDRDLMPSYADLYQEREKLRREFGVAAALPHRPKAEPQPVDPLDVVYDRLPLRKLLELDAHLRQDRVYGTVAPRKEYFTERQRIAIALHWSLQLSEKQRAAREIERERERNRVVVDLDW